MTDTIATLADPDRRTVLSCLEDYRVSVDIEELAADVVAVRDDVPREAVSEADRDAVLVRLHHVDLPKLEQAGFVDFDPEAGTARRRRGETAAAASVLSD